MQFVFSSIGANLQLLLSLALLYSCVRWTTHLSRSTYLSMRTQINTETAVLNILLISILSNEKLLNYTLYPYLLISNQLEIFAHRLPLTLLWKIVNATDDTVERLTVSDPQPSPTFTLLLFWRIAYFCSVSVFGIYLLACLSIRLSSSSMCLSVYLGS